MCGEIRKSVQFLLIVMLFCFVIRFLLVVMFLHVFAPWVGGQAELSCDQNNEVPDLQLERRDGLTPWLGLRVRITVLFGPRVRITVLLGPRVRQLNPRCLKCHFCEASKS